MDRSFLSKPEVIAAARQFVCIRLATYEDKSEGELLQLLCPTRSGQLENTVFTLLSSDGKRELARTSRSANHTFGDAATMVAAMNRVARDNPSRKDPAGLPELPLVANVRLAINVASADNLPLLIVFAPESAPRRQMQERLRPLAWGERFVGRFTCAVATDATELTPIEGARATPGILLVQPDRFGQKAQALRQLPADASADELAKGLEEGVKAYQKTIKVFASHVREGHRQGVFWETVLPVTDPMERQARERGRNSGARPE
jgi:hypothetical protein